MSANHSPLSHPKMYPPYPCSPGARPPVRLPRRECGRMERPLLLHRRQRYEAVPLRGGGGLWPGECEDVGATAAGDPGGEVRLMLRRA